jgi:hypothetical protein
MQKKRASRRAKRVMTGFHYGNPDNRKSTECSTGTGVKRRGSWKALAMTIFGHVIAHAPILSWQPETQHLEEHLQQWLLESPSVNVFKGLSGRRQPAGFLFGAR